MLKEELKRHLKHGLIVSCQALPHEPLYTQQGGIMPLLAKAAMMAKAAGIRANSVRDIRQIKEVVSLPVIGIIKQDYDGYEAYITPTMKEVDDLVTTGCEIIAVDCTKNRRPYDLSAVEYITKIKEKYPDICLMADISDLDEALAASQAGVDFIGTTLSGYVKGNPKVEGPNFELVKQILKQCPTPVIAEGRIHYPSQAKEMLELGVFAVVVGGAITRPMEITDRFVREMKKVYD